MGQLSIVNKCTDKSFHMVSAYHSDTVIKISNVVVFIMRANTEKCSAIQRFEQLQYSCHGGAKYRTQT